MKNCKPLACLILSAFLIVVATGCEETKQAPIVPVATAKPTPRGKVNKGPKDLTKFQNTNSTSYSE